MTKALSEIDLRAAYADPLGIPNYPNNSQSVERAVKLVSDACHKVYGQKNRHDLIISIEAARKERPAYEQKRDYKRFIGTD